MFVGIFAGKDGNGLAETVTLNLRILDFGVAEKNCVEPVVHRKIC